jgi:hypothetical protein
MFDVYPFRRFNVVPVGWRGYNAWVKRLFKWSLRLAVLIAVPVVFLLVFKDSILRVVTERRIRSQTGMEVKIGKLSFSLFSPVVTIENLKLYNTAEFGGTPFLDVRELHLELDPIGLAEHKLHIKLIRFNLAELDVVRNAAGRTNLFSMMNKVKSPGSKKGGSGDLLQGFDFTGIDVFDLSLGKARFVDLKDPGKNLEIPLGLHHQVFKNVKSDADVYGILFMIWLRSGGKFSLAPTDLSSDYLGRKKAKIERTFRQAAEQAAGPVRK